MEIQYLYVSIFFFYGTFTRASTNNIDSATKSTVHIGRSKRKPIKVKPDSTNRKYKVRDIAKEEIILILSAQLFNNFMSSPIRGYILKM